MHLFILFGALLAQSAGAAVYKWYDEQGNVHFTDTPREGAVEVHVPPPQTYESPPLPAFTPTPPEQKKAPGYSRFELIAPADDATIRDNLGALTVSFALDPALKPGHKIRLLLNGEVRKTSQSVTINLENVHRGTHSLQGQVVDGRGKVQISSDPITVHMHRQIISRPATGSPPPPAKK